jgi:serine/threonine protein kinase
MSPSLTLPDLTGSFVDEGYLQLLELIGCGSFARVYKASDTTSDPDSPAFYAVKCMKKWEAGTRHAFMVDNEIALHQQVSDNAGVVTLHRTFSDADYIYLVLDLSMEGDLLSAIIKRNPYVSPGLIQQMFVQLLDTVEYCHQQGVYHRDLKPQNILCDLQAASVKLADFGLATSGEESANFRCGSLSYMSPGSCFCPPYSNRC